ncbi:MAG: glycosyltransferase [candidate division KSB1 bacterium]|nr:glycosyltransferase [candidate division KSB1 bacterium]
MMLILLLVLIFVSLLYVFKITMFFAGLFKLSIGHSRQQFRVTILVPARNEEQNIGCCLESLVRQSYPKTMLEIIVIDDDSQDRTAEIVREYCQHHANVRLLSLGRCPTGVAPKKRALQFGVDAAQGEIIFTTDADCVAAPEWVEQMIAYFEPDVGMVVGWVLFASDKLTSLFHKIQALEFLGLTAAGMGSIGLGEPIIANGANLAFRKTTFREVHGYRDEQHIISGDDDLLLQKIDRTTGWKIRGAISPTTFVYTQPMSNLNDFINQRIRWASKGFRYKKIGLVIFLVATYLFYLLLMISLPFSIRYFSVFPYPGLALLLKLIVDFLIIAKATAMVHQPRLTKYFLLAELFQIPYIIYVGFASIVQKFEWKGR